MSRILYPIGFVAPSTFRSPSPFPFPSPLLLSIPSPFPVYVPSRVSTPVSVPVPDPLPAPVPVLILRSFVCLHPVIMPVPPITVHVPAPTPDPILVSFSTPDLDPAPDPVCSFPFLEPGYPLGTMCVYRSQCTCMRMYVYAFLGAYNRAIRPCHPSHYIPLIFVLPRRDQ